jgi:two-component system NtrC family sensor kinase
VERGCTGLHSPGRSILLPIGIGMRTRHLKTRIALCLMFFIGLGMILIDLVLGLMSYRRLISAEIVQAKAALSAISRQVQYEPVSPNDTIRYVSDLSDITGLGVILVNAEKQVVYGSTLDLQVAEQLAVFTAANISGVNVEQYLYGSHFSLIGLQYDHLFLSSPLRSPQGESLGAVGFDISLKSLTQPLWKDQPLVWVYIFFNVVVLSGLAYWRFSRLLIVPLQQIAEKAASYQDDDFYLTSDFRSDDVSTLSRSLDQMFSRIHNDRKELQKMVTALEEVNESLTRAQADMIRAEKLASVGRLSAGIAHEIGNPVGIVLGYLELLKQDNITRAERLDFTTRAMAEIQRINTIIRQLLDLARPTDGGHGSCSVHRILESFRDDMALKAVAGDMELRFDLAATDDVVEMDSEKLRQVFLNLILNGVDAVKEVKADGQMTIATALIPAEGPGGCGLEIRFVDNGPGIEPEHLKQVFDPFFTTKEVGYGTGLGLSVSYMIIENGGGTIQAMSHDVGSEFRIILPLAEH